METKTDNELIAEFMGEVYIPANLRSFYDEQNLKRFQYSWDALMPVVEKIGKHVYEEHEQDDGIEKKWVKDTAFMWTFHNNMARINRMPLHEGETQIEAVHSAVVEFIKWFNQHGN